MDVDKVRRQYRRTAWLYDRLIAAPTERLRREAVSHLRLRPGDRVLEVVEQGDDGAEELGDAAAVGRCVQVEHAGAAESPRTADQLVEDRIGGETSVRFEGTLARVDVFKHIWLEWAARPWPRGPPEGRGHERTARLRRGCVRRER